MQVAAGAPGVCAAKLGEAEAMVAGGIEDVFIANQLVGATKIARLISLAERARISVAVDDARNIVALSQATSLRGITLGVLVEVDVGMKRCGVDDAEAALSLARQITDAKGLEFRGLMGYEGHVMGIKDHSERANACREAMAKVTAVADYIRSHGLPVTEVTGGGTMTYDISGVYPGVTEIEAGSYALMDTNFADMGAPFQCAMSLLTSIVSVVRPARAICDAGMKSITHEFGLPRPKNLPGVILVKLSEEHGALELTEGAKLSLGDKLELLPSHGCTTVNLHDYAYAIRNGKVEEVWEITGRGEIQ
jgi:D-serine deaminase-like pyridoxal phosphate-dependent protein